MPSLWQNWHRARTTAALPSRPRSNGLRNSTRRRKVTRLERLGGFRLRVRFTDGSEGAHDFAALVNEPGPNAAHCATRPISALRVLEFGAPTWPNGFDIAPEWLRREMEKAGELTRVAAE